MHDQDDSKDEEPARRREMVLGVEEMAPMRSQERKERG